MLIRFSFKNFKSFKNENCLDMESTSLKEHEYNVAKTENGEYLKVSAIYGAMLVEKLMCYRLLII